MGQSYLTRADGVYIPLPPGANPLGSTPPCVYARAPHLPRAYFKLITATRATTRTLDLP